MSINKTDLTTLLQQQKLHAYADTGKSINDIFATIWKQTVRVIVPVFNQTLRYEHVRINGGIFPNINIPQEDTFGKCKKRNFGEEVIAYFPLLHAMGSVHSAVA
jgi:hypothetical protein